MQRTMTRPGIKQVWVSDDTKAEAQKLAKLLTIEAGGEAVSLKDALAVAVSEALAKRTKKGGRKR